MTRPSNNVFDLTHDVKMSGKMGNLIPTLALECVPGDKFHLGTESMLRFAPLLAPVMHRIDIAMHYFFVPNRLTWENWETFITGGEDGILPNPPYINLDSSTSGPQRKFLDYFGIPPWDASSTTLTRVSALPMAAYNLIYNEYYRDQNLIEEINYQLSDGANVLADFTTMQKRAFEHDYFTASLPFAQKGAAVDIPLGVVTLKDTWISEGQPRFVRPDGSTLLSGTADNLKQNSILGPSDDVFIQQDVVDEALAYDPTGTLEVGPTTINDLRRAFKLQEWLEKNARGGTRYTEAIYSHFGVKSPDARLQRPEYITGTKAPVIISEVLNTTGTDDAPQGDMAGHAIGVTSGKTGSYYCQEHGYIIGILSVMPRTAYQQGIPKHYLKRDYLDYFFPSFAHLGEQEVQNQELYAYQNDAEATFGYVPRYAEYKYLPSRVAGDFRTTLNFWHLGRIFDTQPALNKDFIECNDVDFNRIFAVQDDTDTLWMHILHKIKAIRPMPKFGTPTI